MPMEGEKSGFWASTLDRPAGNFPYKHINAKTGAVSPEQAECLYCYVHANILL